MDNSLIVSSGSAVSEAVDIDNLPGWLAFLIGAYPQAKVNTLTFLAYETAFSGVDAGAMLTAVRHVANVHKFASFPTIAQIQTVLDGQKWQNDFNTVPRETVPGRFDRLRQERHNLIEAMYSGVVDTAACEALIAELRQMGRPAAAEHLAGKLEKVAK